MIPAGISVCGPGPFLSVLSDETLESRSRGDLGLIWIDHRAGHNRWSFFIYIAWASHASGRVGMQNETNTSISIQITDCRLQTTMVSSG